MTNILLQSDIILGLSLVAHFTFNKVRSLKIFGARTVRSKWTARTIRQSLKILPFVVRSDQSEQPKLSNSEGLQLGGACFMKWNQNRVREIHLRMHFIDTWKQHALKIKTSFE